MQAVQSLAQRAPAGPIRFCVFVDDGAPNAKQRALMADAVRGVSTRAAVISSSALARHTITAFGWLGADMQGFAPSALVEVGRYLQLDEAQLEDALDVAGALAASIGGVLAVSAARAAEDRELFS